MLVSFIVLAIALFTQTLSRTHVSDRERNIFTFISRACLIFSLVIAPWSLKFLILATVLLIPSCTQGDSNGQPHCSQQCIARSTCSHSHD
jgi:hypothetical protein